MEKQQNQNLFENCGYLTTNHKKLYFYNYVPLILVFYNKQYGVSDKSEPFEDFFIKIIFVSSSQWYLIL